MKTTLLIICLALAVNAQPLKPARVSSVTDSDTVKLVIGQDIVKVRLNRIDAPEKRQAGGKESRQALRAPCCATAARSGYSLREKTAISARWASSTCPKVPA